MAIMTFSQMMRTACVNAYAVYYGQSRKRFFKRFPADKTVVLICTVLQIGVFAILGPAFNSTFAKLFTSGNANYFGNLTAWIFTVGLFPILLRISPLKNLDAFTPALPLGLVFVKIACFCFGCCSGFAADTFYFNQATNRREFPVQLVESGVALLLLFVLLVYRKRTKHSGTVFPLYLASYSASRFFTEFLRDDFPNVWGPLDAYQIISIVFLVFAMVLFFLMIKYGDAINTFFENRNQAFADRKIAAYKKNAHKRKKHR